MKITNKKVVARSAYGETKAKPLSKIEKRQEQNIKICLKCTKKKCNGWCDKMKGKRN